MPQSIGRTRTAQASDHPQTPERTWQADAARFSPQSTPHDGGAGDSVPSGGRPSRCHAMLGRAETNSLTGSPAPPTHRGQCAIVNRSARRAMHSSQRGQFKNTVPLPRGRGSSARATITLPAARRAPARPLRLIAPQMLVATRRDRPTPRQTIVAVQHGRRDGQHSHGLGFNHALALRADSEETNRSRPLTEARVTRSKRASVPARVRRHPPKKYHGTQGDTPVVLPGLSSSSPPRPRIVGEARAVERPDRRPAGAEHTLPPSRDSRARARRARSSPREQERGLGWPIDRARRWLSGP